MQNKKKVFHTRLSLIFFYSDLFFLFSFAQLKIISKGNWNINTLKYMLLLNLYFNLTITPYCFHFCLFSFLILFKLFYNNWMIFFSLIFLKLLGTFL